MRLELKGFQDVAVEELLNQLRAAQREAVSYPQAVLLSAPTGAGKTVVATAVIEALIDGDERTPGGEPTILWLTDQPELNEQTKRKMFSASSVLDDSRLITIEPNFQERLLAPGKVYFLNTQKLGRNSSLVQPRDQAPWNLWDTIRDSVKARPQDFLLIIDEAHRGMSESAADREQAQTIVQRFIKGDGELDPVPMIFGISATPQRFLSLVAGKRTLRPQIDITAEDVRESGLIKQTLLVYHPRRVQPSDFTLLQSASERVAAYAKSWEDYAKRTGTGEWVTPMLVVQVANAPSGMRGGVTETDLVMALSIIEATLGPLEDGAIAHCFQEQVAVPVGDGRVLPYVAPSDIQDNTNLRVVFFKSALTTGWDCPRAEVMMSFRKAVDHTLIAQLVGRMVRTPLARTIDGDEFLNTCSLYLPHYDTVGLDRVLNRLQADDPEYMPPIDVRRGESWVSLHQNPEKLACFETLASLPTYDVQRVRSISNLRRLVKLARLLDRDQITRDELADTHYRIVEILQAARARLDNTDWWGDVVKEAGTLDLRTVEWAIGVGSVSETQSLVPITQKNVDDLFAAAGRRLGEGLHKVYWRARADQDPSQRVIGRIAKLEAFVLSQHAETEKELDEFADSRVEWLQAEYGVAIDALSPDRQEGYRMVRLTAKDPQARTLDVFERIEGQREGTAWDDHLYVDDNGAYHYAFRSSWEPIVLEGAMAEKAFQGWLRIEDRKDWSLTIPYRMGNEVKPLYPDFLVFHKVKGRVVADLLDPHDPGRDDWLPKVKGLAEYAAKHWQRFGKIEASFVERRVVHRLNLAVEHNRVRALNAEGVNGLRDLFVAD